MPYTIGVDIGGTFTDSFATDERGNVFSAKSPSTPPDYESGVINSIGELAAAMQIGITDLLPQVTYICHGTTSSLNALVTGRVADVGLITTAGHADSIYMMNAEGRYAGLSPEEIQDVVSTNKPRPLISKRFVREVIERIDYSGSVIVPLNEELTRSAIRSLKDTGVQAIAVSLLWSFLNPAHELRVRELIREEAPSMYVTLSCELSPRIREYARTSTTVMSTQIAPPLKAYLEPLEQELRERGFSGSLLVMQGSGGSISAAEAPSQAITTVGSVLTGGVVGCRQLGAELGHQNIISTDQGGTTFLVGLVVDGQPVTSASSVINQYAINIPMVRVSAIGGGGGAIAHVDDGGNLRVGPDSAAALPGPACYDQGGTLPTITDADVVLGIISPENFLGGKKLLHRELAEKAIRDHVAEPMGMTVEQAAAAIYSIASSQAADLVRRVVVNEGHDPRDFVLYSFGGAAPARCVAYARDLGVHQAVIPLGSTASTFSAYGLASSNVVLSAELSQPANFPLAGDVVNGIFTRLEDDLHKRLAEQGVDFVKVTMERQMDIRYTMQLAEVATPVVGGHLSDTDVQGIGSDFEGLYERLYGKGAGFREAGLQVITYRVFGTGHLPFTPQLPELAPGSGAPAPRQHRPVLLEVGRGFEDTPVYDYSDLGAGDVISGPAVIEAPTTTATVPYGVRAVVDRLGNLTINFE